MSEQPAVFADNGAIIQRGDVDTNPAYQPKGAVDIVVGMYCVLNDGTVAGPMELRETNGDVYRYFGLRHYIDEANEDAEAILLGGIWLDSKGNAHSDPSPLDARAEFIGAFW